MTKKNHISVAICGTRGVPARYGGFETFAEELGKRLVNKNFKVRVYSRFFLGGRSSIATDNNPSNYYLGMEIKPIISVKHKYLETPLHSLFCFIHLIFNRVDLVILCNAANSPFSFILRLFQIPFIINVDGIERSRRKWNALGKAWYYLGEACSSLFSNRVVSDATYIKEYYLSAYATESTLIRYGSKTLERDFAEKKINNNFDWISEDHLKIINNFSLVPGSYFLYVSRLEPENNADKVILAYAMLEEELRKKFPLVVVGDAPYSDKFKDYIRSIAPNEVRFLGYQFEQSYVALQSAAYLYIQATEVGGTHPALVEAMGFSNAIIANRVKEHEEVLLDTGLYYSYNNIYELSECLIRLVENQSLATESRRSAYERAVLEFDWDSVTESYIKLSREILLDQRY